VRLAARSAATVAKRVLDADIGLVDGSRMLLEHLRALGEFDAGDFSGPFAALTFFVFETDLYPSESERASCSEEDRAQADRWLPTIFFNHRSRVMDACRAVIAKYEPMGAEPTPAARTDPAAQSRLADGPPARNPQQLEDAPDQPGRLKGEGGASIWREP
jgi:hypothetical protein